MTLAVLGASFGCADAVGSLAADVRGEVTAESNELPSIAQDRAERDARAEADDLCRGLGSMVQRFDVRKTSCDAMNEGPPYRCTIKYRAWCYDTEY